MFCVADCTGHGVPGAFMSLIGNSYLKLSLNEPSVNSPAQALDFLNKGVISTLQQNNTEKIKDLIDPAKDNLKIHEEKSKGVYIQDITEVDISSEDDVFEALR